MNLLTNQNSQWIWPPELNFASQGWHKAAEVSLQSTSVLPCHEGKLFKEFPPCHHCRVPEKWVSSLKSSPSLLLSILLLQGRAWCAWGKLGKCGMQCKSGLRRHLHVSCIHFRISINYKVVYKAGKVVEAWNMNLYKPPFFVLYLSLTVIISEVVLYLHPLKI